MVTSIPLLSFNYFRIPYFVGPLAKENSKAKNAVNVPVDYCLVKFVRRIPNGKSGMVNYTNFNTIFVK